MEYEVHIVDSISMLDPASPPQQVDFVTLLQSLREELEAALRKELEGKKDA